MHISGWEIPTFTTIMADFNALPDDTTIIEASNLEVFDINGDKVKFGTIIEKQKTIVVFISMQLFLHPHSLIPLTSRIGHFFCGVRY